MIEIHIVEKKEKKYKNVEVYDFDKFISELGVIFNKSLPWWMPFKKKIRSKFISEVNRMIKKRLKLNINRKNGKQGSKRKKNRK